MSVRATILVLALAASACGPSATTPSRVHAASRPRLGGDVVAVVGAAAIRRGDVAARASASHVDAATALHRLEAEALLADEARRRGLHAPNDAERPRRALAQLVLRAMEREHGASGVPEDAIVARMDHARATLTHTERRQASHLLVRPTGTGDAARARAEAIAAEALRLATQGELDDASALERLAERVRGVHPDADLVVESLPVLERDTPYEAPFLDAMFSMDHVGLVPHVVTTSFGSHVVLVTRVEHAVIPTPDAVREAALTDALNHDRRNAVGVVLREARTRTPPRIDEALVRRRLGDDRQYVNAKGQGWTTLEALQANHVNELRELEPGLLGIGSKPQIAIGERALVIQRPDGGVMWDCTPLITEGAISAIKAKGGVKAIAISHPHFYATMVDWSRALGGVPVYLHEDNRDWVMRPDDCIEYWSGESEQIADGVTLIRTGGHFPGSTVLHWTEGAGGKGVLMTGDSIMVVPDTRWVSFMYSFPNLIPLNAKSVERIVKAVRAYQFDRIYAGWWDRVLDHDAKDAVQRSAERYIAAIR